MGIPALLRDASIKTIDLSSDKDDKKKLIKAVLAFKRIHENKEGTVRRSEFWEKSQAYYKGQQWPDEVVKTWQRQNKKKKKAQIPPTANYYAWAIDTVKDLIMEAESKVIAKLLPQRTPIDAETVGDLNEVFDYYRRDLKWLTIRGKAIGNMCNAGTGIVYVGWDSAGGAVKKVAIKEGKGYKTKIVTKGVPYFESLHPKQIALDSEASEIGDSRTVVITRQMTREDLIAMFPDKKDDINTRLDNLAKKQNQKKREAEGKSLIDKGDENQQVSGDLKEEKTFALYEILIDANPFTDYFPSGLHAYMIQNLILSEEEAWWEQGNKPIGWYLFSLDPDPEADDASPMGISKFWQIIPIQFYENLFLAYVIAAAQNDVTNTKIASKDQIGKVELMKLQTDPGTVVECRGNANTALALAPASRAAAAILLALDRMRQIREALSATYDPKYGFKGGDRKVGELQILGEKQLNAYKDPIKRTWEGDIQVWKALYYVLKRNVKAEEVLFMPNNKEKSGYKEITLSPNLFSAQAGASEAEQRMSKTFGKTDKNQEQGRATPLEYDFEISQEALPKSPSMRRQEIFEEFSAGLMGPPESEEALYILHETLKQSGIEPDNPIWRLDEEIKDGIVEWIEKVNSEPTLAKTLPVLSRFWRLGVIARMLDTWYAERGNSLGEAGRYAYRQVRIAIEEQATLRMEERILMQEMMKARVAAKLTSQNQNLPGRPGYAPQTPSEETPPPGVEA